VAETCEQCGAPLASDQRYCLECGQRRGGPRVDYRHYMGGSSQPSEPGAPAEPAAPAPGEEPAKPQRDFAPLAAVGGIAVLGLMLLVGVLIGKGSGDSTAATPAPVVIKGPSGGTSGSESGGSSKNTDGLNIGGKEKKAKKGGNGGGGTGNAVQASENDLEELGKTSGEDYVKQSENLPNEIATPGKPPPIDTSKPPGGGEGGAEVIK
jgi:hypothetical protein